MQNTEVEMRAFERVKLCCSADLMVSGASGAEHVFVTDLSESGAFAQTRLKLRRGEKMLMRLRLDDEKVATLPCEVSWARPFDPISVDGQMAGLGLRFRDVELTEQALLREHVMALLKKPQVVQAKRAACAVEVKEATTEPGKFQVASANSISSTHDVEAWQDTLVDEPSVSLPPEGALSLGCEPALGDLDLSQMSRHGTSLFPRSPRSWTPWLAVGSLLMGIAAGGVYALMAPRPLATTQLVEHTQPLLAPTPPQQDAQQQAPQLAKKSDAARAKTQKAVPAKQAKAKSKKATGHSAKGHRAMGQALSGVLNGPINTGQGWFVTIKGGASALHNFTLEGPPRAVIDLTNSAGQGLQSQQIARGPFKSLRVGQGSDKIRLVFDLEGKVNTRTVRFVTKGKDLLIEIPRAAMAQR